MLNWKSADPWAFSSLLWASISSSVKGEMKGRRRTRSLRLLVDRKLHFKYVKYFYYKKIIFLLWENSSINKREQHNNALYSHYPNLIISKTCRICFIYPLPFYFCSSILKQSPGEFPGGHGGFTARSCKPSSSTANK